MILVSYSTSCFKKTIFENKELRWKIKLETTRNKVWESRHPINIQLQNDISNLTSCKTLTLNYPTSRHEYGSNIPQVSITRAQARVAN